MIKTFSEGITTEAPEEFTEVFQTEVFQTEFDLKRWKGVTDPIEILRDVPEEHWTNDQYGIINKLTTEQMRKIPSHFRTEEMKKWLGQLGRMKNEKEKIQATARLKREAVAATQEGEWTRWKPQGSTNFLISFPALKDLAQPGKAAISEPVIEKIEQDLQIGRTEIGIAVGKAATRQMMTEEEAKIMKRLVPHIALRQKILWPRSAKPVQPVKPKVTQPESTLPNSS